jgi:hypothetical protein
MTEEQIRHLKIKARKHDWVVDRPARTMSDEEAEKIMSAFADGIGKLMDEEGVEGEAERRAYIADFLESTGMFPTGTPMMRPRRKD